MPPTTSTEGSTPPTPTHRGSGNHPPTRQRRRWTRQLAGVVLAGAVSVAAVACGGSADHEVGGWVRQPLPVVDTVALPDVSNGDAPFEFTAPPGELLLVYFGFTFCPDVCPTTLSDLQAALGELGDDAERVEVAFVTVDPGRDDGEKLTSYIGFFTDGRGHALRTEDPELLAAAAEPFGVEYEVTINEEGEIEVGHTASLFVVDDRGRLLLTWPFGTPPEVLAGDLAWLLEAEDGAAMEAQLTT